MGTEFKKVETFVYEKVGTEPCLIINSFVKDKSFTLVFPSEYFYTQEELEEYITGNDNYKFVETAVGYHLHCIQQAGGELFYDSKEVKAMDIKQCSGFALDRDEKLFVGEEEKLFGEM